jgi:serine/threonine protein kinase
MLSATKDDGLVDGANRVKDANGAADYLQIPGFRLLEKLGEGGAGAVYRALQQSPRREVAIKVLTPGQSVSAFERESRLMAALAHPHVVAIHGFGETPDGPYLVMDYIGGTSLRSLMEPGQPWPVDRTIRVISAIGSALAHIHTQGILHLDLKPENVLCGADGEIKITDFGLARSRIDAERPAELGRTQGTIDYGAPEQRYGLRVDARADLFALATLAYELLTGRLPGRVYVPARHANAAVPAALDDILRQALARDRDGRQACVEDFVAAVRHAADDCSEPCRS